MNASIHFFKAFLKLMEVNITVPVNSKLGKSWVYVTTGEVWKFDFKKVLSENFI